MKDQTAVPAPIPRLSAPRALVTLTALALAACLTACAEHSLAESERETGEILTRLDAEVAAERAAAKTASAKRAPRDEVEIAVPKVIGLADALRVAGRRNRDLLRQREGLVFSAISLRNAQNAIGPRLSGTLGYTLAGRDDGADTTGQTGTLAANAILPTGAAASVTASAASMRPNSLVRCTTCWRCLSFVN